MLVKERKHKRKMTIIFLFVFSLCTLVGCDNEDIEEQNVEQSKDALSNAYKTYKIRSIPLKSREFQSKVTRLAGLMAKNKDLASFEKKGLDLALEKNEKLFTKPFQNAPDMFVSYDPRKNKISIQNEGLLIPELEAIPKYAANPNGIGEAKAKSIMQGFLRKLNTAKLASIQNYDIKNVRVGYYKTARGPVDEPEKEEMWIDEYLFTMDRIIDGIRVHGDYIRIGVHRTGEVSSIRIAEKNISATSLPSVTRSVSKENIVDKFYAEIPWDSEPVILENEVAYIKKGLFNRICGDKTAQVVVQAHDTKPFPQLFCS